MIPEVTRTSNAGTGLLAGPRTALPSASRKALPWAGHVTVASDPPILTGPRCSGAPLKAS